MLKKYGLFWCAANGVLGAVNLVLGNYVVAGINLGMCLWLAYLLEKQ